MFLNTIIKTLPHVMSKSEKPKQSLFTKLVKSDNNFSTINFFLVATTAVGILLLIVPMIAMIVDLCYNHTLTIDLNGMAAYIVAVAGIFASAGIANAWTEYSYKKYDKNIFKDNDNSSDIV